MPTINFNPILSSCKSCLVTHLKELEARQYTPPKGALIPVWLPSFHSLSCVQPFLVTHSHGTTPWVVLHSHSLEPLWLASSLLLPHPVLCRTPTCTGSSKALLVWSSQLASRPNQGIDHPILSLPAYPLLMWPLILKPCVTILPMKTDRISAIHSPTFVP